LKIPKTGKEIALIIGSNNDHEQGNITLFIKYKNLPIELVNFNVLWLT
jgi:hypothetical protein